MIWKFSPVSSYHARREAIVTYDNAKQEKEISNFVGRFTCGKGRIFTPAGGMGGYPELQLELRALPGCR
jgi:hypothetical protein